MSIRMSRPERKKIELSRGDWLLVKKRLNAGENQDMLEAMLQEDGIHIRGSRVGFSQVKAYLLDWSFQDAEGHPLVILDQPDDVVTAALRGIDDDDFSEVFKAIDAHISAMKSEREKEKNGQASESASLPDSPSVAS